MYRKKALIIGIIGGSIGGIAAGYFGTLYGNKFGFNPFLIAFLTGVFSIGIAVLLAKLFK